MSISSVEGQTIEASAHPVDHETSTGIAVSLVSLPSTESSHAALLKRALQAELRASKAENDLFLFASEHSGINAVMNQLSVEHATNLKLHADMTVLLAEKEAAEKRARDSESELSQMKIRFNKAMAFARHAVTTHPDLHPRRTQPSGIPVTQTTQEASPAQDTNVAQATQEASPTQDTNVAPAKPARKVRSNIRKTKDSRAASSAKSAVVDKDAFFWENCPIPPKLKRVRFDEPPVELPLVQRVVSI